MNKITIGIVLLCLVVLVPYVSGQNVTNIKVVSGSSFINWTWTKDNLTEVAIWIDGNFMVNSSFNYFILSDLQPREFHTIDLINVTNSSIRYASDEEMTKYPFNLYYILLLLSISFLLLELLFTKNSIICILFGLICFFISITTLFFSFVYFLSVFTYLMIGIAAIAVVWILGALFTMLSESRSYEEEIM